MKMSLVSSAALAAFVVLASSLTGCGGSGAPVVASPFAGPRFLGFYDQDNSNSSWAGSVEVVIKDDGTFEDNGALYTHSNGAMVTNKATYDQLIAARKKGEKPQATRGGDGGGGGLESHEGTILNGSIKTDGTFHFEAKVDSGGWPLMPLETPYYMVGDGDVHRRGAHWEGIGTMRYYEANANGTRGALMKEIPYDFEIGRY